MTESSARPRHTAIDLFCGCGGLTLGLHRAGFNVLAAVDSDPLATSTYRSNHQGKHPITADIRFVDAPTLMSRLGFKAGQLDLLAGCPPCQGFSTLRTLNGGRRVAEPMNDLVFEFVRFARILKPKALMMENVPALLNDARLVRVRKELRGLGYTTNARVFDAAEYGVPQRRRRLILFACRDGLPSFADPVDFQKTVADAIRELPTPLASHDPAHNYSVHRAERVMSLIRRIPKDGGSRTDLGKRAQLKCHRDFDGFRDVYGRMAWQAPAPTITSGCINPSKGRFLHPTEDRAITLREAALLQGFPRRYEFDLSKGRYAAARMIGNAFPPTFAELHAGAIRRHLMEVADNTLDLPVPRSTRCQ